IMEDENGHDVFVKNFDPEGDIKDAKETINFTENSKYTEEVESKLTGIKKGVDQQSIYEQIEEERNQITPREFLKLPLKDRLKLVTNIRSTDELQENTLLVISFGQNEALERQIGLGDLMPPKIRKMECHDGVYSRAGTQGFYANGEYLPIFDGTRVTIIERDENYNPLNDFKFNKEYAKGNEKIEGLEITKNDVMQLALSFQIDPLLLEATLKNVSNIENTDDQFEQAHMAARYIQNAEHKYHAKYPDKELLKDGKYTIEFVLYSLDRFNLFNFYYEQPESVVVNVTKSYGLEYTPEVKAKREEIKPKTPENWGTYTGGEIFYQQDEVVEPTKKMKENLESRMRALKEYYNELVAKGECTREKADKVVSNAERIYKTMDSRMGTWYHDKVAIKRPGENPWVITNNCVGAAMKTIEDSDFRLQRGRQKGKSAANFYWGTYKDGNRDFAGDRKKGFEWLKSMTDSNSQIVEEHLVNPADADAIIGPHLAPGECAPAGLWNHAIWIYKEANGRVMVYHSGGDYRPKRITLQPGEEVPPGYARSGNSNIAWKQYNQKRPPGKQSSSKVNAVPLSYLLAQSTHYRDNKPSFRNAIHFVPLGTLVDANS
ncbi:hypothetical protein KKG51_01830, partial [Patescibacteria group bacterium]|nr:hypothetical protein [Patescibacteria group bacterium]